MRDLENRNYLPGQGAIAGLVAGALFAALQMIVAVAARVPWFTPWRMAASLVLGEGAVTGQMRFGYFIVGLGVHFLLSAIFGMGFGAIALAVPRRIRTHWGAHAAAASLLGVGLWLINFQVIARLAYPWFNTETNPGAQVLLHAFAFGLPVGMYLTAAARRLEGIERRTGIPRRTSV